MPGAVRLSDMSTGHPHCYPATPAVGASQNVIVMVGDKIGLVMHGRRMVLVKITARIVEHRRQAVKMLL